MTPPAATAAARTPHARTARPRPASRPAPSRVPPGARRVSGPAGGLRAVRSAQPAFAGAGSIAAPAFGARALRRAAAVQDARLLDRLIRGRAWIVLVAAMLMGLVFLQVSLLQLNAGIGRAVATAQTLQLQNSELRSAISTVDSAQRVVQDAGNLGMVMPGPADITYLRAVSSSR